MPTLDQQAEAKNDYVVAKPLRFAGKDYPYGAPFPWRRLSVSNRKLRQLVEGRYIVHEEDLTRDDTAQVEEPPKGGNVFTFDPKLHEVKEVDGRWIVADSEGNELLELDEDEADRLKRLRTKAVDINIDEEEETEEEDDEEEDDEEEEDEEEDDED